MGGGLAPRLGGGRMVRSVNRALVLAALEAGPASRAGIAKSTGLNKATVSSQAAELIDAGLIREKGIGDSEMGRKPVLLEMDGTAGYAFGVGLAAEGFRLVARDLAGSLTLERYSPLSSRRPADTAATISAAVDQALAELPRSRYGLVGLGLAIPGVVDTASETIIRATLLDWSEVELLPAFAERYDCPISLGNDAKLAAAAERAEARRGGGIEDDLLCVIVGEGIGVGALLAGEPYAGPQGYFGEAGHMTIVHGGRLCTCGNRGCWDAYASQKALAGSLAATLGLVEDGARIGAARGRIPDAARILELGRSTTPAILACFERYADYLSSGLMSLVNLFSPSAIVVHSEILASLPLLFATVQAKVLSRSMTFNRGCAIRLSSLGPRAPALGAAMAAAKRFLDAATEDLGTLSGPRP